MDAGGMDGDLNGGGGVCCLSSFIDEGSIESHRYHLSRRTVLEMLKDRGYVVPDSEIELSLNDFRSIYGAKPDVDRLRISASLRSDPTKKVPSLLFSLSKHLCLSVVPSSLSSFC